MARISEFLRFSLLLFWVSLPVWSQVQSVSLKTLTLCWDASASMAGNEPVYALRYLDAVFGEHPDCRVRLLAFRTDVEESLFEVSGGDWSSLRAALEQIDYDGAALYSVLNPMLEDGLTYIYTDGMQLFEGDRLIPGSGNTILSRATGEQQAFLERSALLYRGQYVQLKPLESGSGTSVPQAPAGFSGTVFIDEAAAPGVVVRVQRSGAESRTDAEGRFTLQANPGDTLVISSGTLEPRYYPLAGEPDVQFFLNSGGVALDEVEVTGVRKKSPTLVRTATGMRDTDRVGVGVTTVSDEEITEIQTDLSQTLQGRVTGVNLKPGQDASQFTTRTNLTMLGDNYGLIVIDGTPVAKSSSSAAGAGRGVQGASFIDPNNIAEMTVLKGLAATNRYGELGRNGVLLITTKNAVYGEGNGAPADRLRLKDNTYEEDLTRTGGSALTTALRAAPPAQAYATYLRLRSRQPDDPGFYLEAYDFFRPESPELAGRILSNLAELHPERPDYLRTVLMGMLAAGQQAPAQAVAGALASRDAADAQAHVHAALLETDRRQRAALVKNLAALQQRQRGAADYLEKEIKDLLRKHPDLSSSIPSGAYSGCPTYKARLVFEWNRPGAEFALQSVNPQKRYYNWEHTRAASPGILQAENRGEPLVKTFDLYGAESVGEWIFNVERIGPGGLDGTSPLVVGCRIYHNFGMASEKVEYRMVHLEATGTKKNLVTLQVR